MATLTIIKDDKFVNVDGVGLILDAVVLPANVHAIQWDGSSGWIEYNDGTDNESLSSIDSYATITNDHATKKAAEEKAVADAADAKTQADNERIALEATYGYKRKYDETTKYASIGDQLDQLYKDMVAGQLDTTGTWATRIKAVKDAHPK